MADIISNALVQGAVAPPLSDAYQAIKLALVGFKDDVESFERTKTTIEAALIDADSLVVHSRSQQDMVEKLRCELDGLTHFLDVIEARAMRRETMGGSRFMKEARLFFSPSNQVVARFFDARKLKDVRNKLDAIARDHAQFGSIVPHQSQVWGTQASELRMMSELVVGRDGDKDNLIKLITDNTGEDNKQMTSDTLSVASIEAIGGMGKTTLAWYVYNDDKVKCSFDIRLWVEVTRDFDVKDILKKIQASSMNEGALFSETEHRQPYQFNDFIRALGGKKFFLVLDNIWDQPDLRLKWLDLKRLLQAGACGSKVLITTRDHKVAGIMDSHNSYILKDLTEEHSWLLFQQIAFSRWHEPGVETIGKEIAKMCPDVPLVIKSIASVLAGKQTVQEWQAFRDDQLANFSSYGRDIVQTLKLSYDQLDTRLKFCVNYCTLFPKGEYFWNDEIIHHWIALGYVKPFYTNQSLEEAGQEYMITLINSGFLSRREYRGFLYRSYKMHDVMYEVVQSLAGFQYKLANSNTTEFDKRVRHVSFDMRKNTCFWLVPSSLFKIKHLKSFITIKNNTNNYPTEVKNWSNCYKLISNFQCIRVLDLCGLGIKELPLSICELICLRFLNLSNTELVKLPNSFTKLVNLQSLYMCDCPKLQKLSKDMSKLVKLRHIKLEGSSKLTRMPLGLGNMTDLRTLDVFTVTESKTKRVGKLGDLNKLNNLEGRLTIKLNMESTRDIVFEANLSNLKMKEKLKQLCIEFKYGTKEDETVLENLEPPVDLSSLTIKGYEGERFPYWMMDDQLKTHLPKLVSIEFTKCNTCTYICSMGNLPNLKNLVLERLDNVEYIENNINNATLDDMRHTTFFPSLKILVIRDMLKLKGWWKISSSGEQVKDQHHLVKWESAFPKLKKLEVSYVDLAIAISKPPLTCFTSLENLFIRFGKAHLTPQRPQALILLSSAFPNLKYLSVMKCELENLPEELRGLSFVEQLDISSCIQLKAIPEWIDSLTSLKTLDIWNCPNLESLPYQISHLPNLKYLNIYMCPILKERCQATTGEYWPYIQHIPHITIR